MWDELKAAFARGLTEAAERAAAAGDLPALPVPLPAFTVERPRDDGHGDLASNLALLLARPLRLAPRRIAEAIAAHYRLGTGHVERLEVAGAGFLNARLDTRWPADALAAVLAAGEGYGRSAPSPGRAPVLVEFVSANPVGPLNVVSARAAAVGDALARVLEAAGHRVWREYYVNDAGGQARLFGQTLLARARGIASGQPVELPEGGYQGEYMIALAREFLAEAPEAGDPLPDGPAADALADRAGRFGMERMLADIRATLERYGVHFDAYVSERALREADAISRTLAELRRRGYVYDADGAEWFRSTAEELGGLDDKDRVLRKSDGEYSYFAVDIAYHESKYARGFETVIDLIGPDHHGYLGRMQAAMRALGHPPESLEMRVVQLVRLVRGGEVVRMSKRRGDFVALDDLLDEVGVDATRFFLVQRHLDSPLDFDLDLALKEGEENPVYYVQYAHARIASILRRPEARAVLEAAGEVDLRLLTVPEEIALIHWLAELPGEVRLAADLREPHRLPRYAMELAGRFHSFYNRHRVLGVEPALSAARLRLIEAVALGVRAALGLIGVGAPDRMERLTPSGPHSGGAGTGEGVGTGGADA
jgi:arginyl-tRNA synthetase